MGSGNEQGHTTECLGGDVHRGTPSYKFKHLEGI